MDSLHRWDQMNVGTKSPEVEKTLLLIQNAYT